MAPIIPIPSGWVDEDRPQGVDDMLGAFFGPPYRDWWLTTAENPQFMMPYWSHWLVSKSAAHAFSRGIVRLNRLHPSMVEYEVRPQPLGPEDPPEINGTTALLGDHSRAGTLKVEPRFVGTHARLSRSIQYIELSRNFGGQQKLQPSKRGFIPNLSPRSALSSLAHPFLATFLTVWLLVPNRLRIVAYRTLQRVAERLYEPESSTVQRLPFGFYLKHTDYPASLRNEVNAMRLARKYTSIPAPKVLDYVEGPVQKEDDDVNQGWAFSQPEEREEKRESYLLMNRIPGMPLSRVHEALADNDMTQVTAQLQDYVKQLRAIPKTVNPEMAICDTLGGPCRETRVRGGNPIGPFVDEAAFSAELRNPDDPARRGHQIYFTHADLNPRNILVEKKKQRDGHGEGWRVSGIIDWEMAGYYPEYWEYTQALYEGFRWTWRYNNMVHGVFKGIGDYSKEFEVEKHAWESGM